MIFTGAKVRSGFAANRENYQLKDVLVEYHMLHVYSSNYMEVRTCRFKGINHIMGHIGAKASLSVYPPVGKISPPPHMRVKGVYARTWAISEQVSDCKGHARRMRWQLGTVRIERNTNSIYIDRFKFVCVSVR